MSALQAEHLWQEAFPEKTRPKLYASDNINEDGFKPLADPQDFLVNLSNLTSLQLYALGENNVLALRAAQDEYHTLSREIAAISGRDPGAVRNPQAFQAPDIFENRKEASLYGYKYEDPKPALLANGQPLAKSGDEISKEEKDYVTLLPEPFFQGQFVPNDRQFKGKLNRAKNLKNPDGWEPIEKDGKFYIPVQQRHHDEYTAAYTRRAVDEKGEIIRPTSVDSDESQLTPGKPELVNKRLTRTRFGGKKHPPTRDASEAPSVSSTPSRKRAVTPVIVEPREATPKRQKVNGVASDQGAKPKHPNQYTKAREREMAAQQAARASAGGAIAPGPTMPDFASMTTEEKLNRKWTDDELRASISADHTWLNPDPTKAAEWRDKILHGINPVRSWSMVKKWSQWKGEGKDKRPRKKLVNGHGGESGSGTPASAPETHALTPDKNLVGGPVGGVSGGGIRSRRSSDGTGVVSLQGESRSRSGTPGTRPTPTRRSTRNR